MRISDWSSDVCSSDLPVAADWWRLYDDPVLDGLVADALANNTDVRVAVANIARARASLRGARADRLPQGGIGAGANYGRNPAGQRLPGADREDWTVDVGANVSYEVDLFGRVSRSEEHTSELQSLMRLSYAVFCLKKKK